MDFDTNKRICSEVAVIPSARLRNKIAGYTTHLMRRISRGPVPGISLKLQEEERERQENYVPDVSVLESLQKRLNIDRETEQLLTEMGMDGLVGGNQRGDTFRR